MAKATIFPARVVGVAREVIRFAILTVGILGGIAILALAEALALKLAGASWSSKQSIRSIHVSEMAVSGSGRWGLSRVLFRRERLAEGVQNDCLLHDLWRRGSAARLHLEALQPQAVAISPAADFVAMTTSDGSLYVAPLLLTDDKSGFVLGSPRRLLAPDPDEAVGRIAFSPDGRTLAAAFRTCVRLWRMPSGEMLSTATCAVGPQAYLSFSKDSRRLLIGGAGGEPTLFDLPSARQIERAVRCQAGIASAALSPDGRTAAFVTTSGALGMWSFDQDKELSRAAEDGASTRKLAFSPDGRLLATADCGARPGPIQLFAAGRGKLVGEIPHATPKTGLLFSPDGRLYCWDADGEILAWNVKERRDVWSFSAAEAAGMFAS